MLDIKAVEKQIRAAALYDLSTVMDDESKRRSPRYASSNNSDELPPPPTTNRQMYVMRHGERVDFTFGPWIPYCFDATTGQYGPKDLNMPRWLPQRKNWPAGWEKDSPLTNMGVHQATLTGQSLADAGVRLEHVYCSPSYRCIQTATGLLEGSFLLHIYLFNLFAMLSVSPTGLGVRDKVKIRIEYGLFEWMIWYPEEMPDWCTKEELSAAGYNIDMDYATVVERDQLKAAKKETCQEFYQRNHNAVEQILKDHCN